jgi:hypothetical protein
VEVLPITAAPTQIAVPLPVTGQGIDYWTLLVVAFGLSIALLLLGDILRRNTRRARRRRSGLE